MALTLAQVFEILTHKMEEHETRVIELSTFRTLSLKQIHYLDIISHMKNPTSGELARRLELSKPSVTAIIDRFESDGFIKKVQSDEDRRIQHIHLTDKGNQISILRDKIHHGFAEYFYQILDADELDQMITLFKKVIDRMP